MRLNNTLPKFISRAMKLRILAGDAPPWMLAHIRSDYIVRCFLSAPLWVKRGDFRALAEQKSEAQRATGIPHSLDHIIPVTHTYVCGLTVPWNMQVLPAKCNGSKRNQWHPDQHPLELQPRPPEQLSLRL